MIKHRLFQRTQHQFISPSAMPTLLRKLIGCTMVIQLCACSTPFAFQQSNLFRDTAQQSRQTAQRLTSASDDAITYELLAPETNATSRPSASLQSIACFRDANLYLNQRAVAVIATTTDSAEKMSHLDDNPLNAQVLKKLRAKENITPGHAQDEVDKLATFFDNCKNQLATDQPQLNHYVPTPSAANVALLKEAEIKQPTALLPSLLANTLALDSLTREIVNALESAQKEEAIRRTLKASLPQFRAAVSTLRDDERLAHTLDRLRLLALRKVASRYQQLQQHRQLPDFPSADDVSLAETLAQDIGQYQTLTEITPAKLLTQLDGAINDIAQFADATTSTEDNLADLTIGFITIKEQMARLATALDHTAATRGSVPG